MRVSVFLQGKQLKHNDVTTKSCWRHGLHWSISYIDLSHWSVLIFYVGWTANLISIKFDSTDSTIQNYGELGNGLLNPAGIKILIQIWSPYQI